MQNKQENFNEKNSHQRAKTKRSIWFVLIVTKPCIGKDLGMSTVAYASLIVELQQDGYTSKTSESQVIDF